MGVSLSPPLWPVKRRIIKSTSREDGPIGYWRMIQGRGRSLIFEISSSRVALRTMLELDDPIHSQDRPDDQRR